MSKGIILSVENGIMFIEFLDITEESCKEVYDLFELYPRIKKRINIDNNIFDVTTWKEYYDYIESLWNKNKLVLGDCCLLQLEEVGEPYTSDTIKKK